MLGQCRSLILAAAVLAASACGGSAGDTTGDTPGNAAGDAAGQSSITVAGSLNAPGPVALGVRVVPPIDAQAMLAEGNRVLIDVRTPEEFAEGRIAGATLIDFKAADFADRIGALDRNLHYVMYCRSGNRSGQARDLMTQLGFTDVADIDGGILAWTEAGLPVEP